MFLEDDKNHINFGDHSDSENRWEQNKASIYRKLSFRRLCCIDFRDKKWEATKCFSKMFLHLAQAYSDRIEEYLRTRKSLATFKTDAGITEIYKNITKAMVKVLKLFIHYKSKALTFYSVILIHTKMHSCLL